MNRILILTPHLKEQQTLEEIFSDVIASGGVLLFAHDKQQMSADPTLVLIDASIYDTDPTYWKSLKGELFVIREKDQTGPEKTLFKPLHKGEVLSACRPYLKSGASFINPM